jgi:hypothetical protein
MRNTVFFRTSVSASKIMFNLDKKAYIRNFVIGILQTISIVGTTVLIQFFIDALSVSIGKDNDFKIVFSLVMLAVVIVLSEITNGYQNYLYEYYIDKGVHGLTNCLHKKINNMERVKLDDLKELSKIERACKGIENLVELVLVLGDAVTFYGLYFLFLGMYFINIDRKMIILLPLIFVPVMLSHLSKIKMFSDMDAENSIYKLQMNQFATYLTNVRYVRELKFLGAEGFFLDKFYTSLKDFQDRIFITNSRGLIRDIAGKVITFVGVVLIILFLTLELIQGKITIGVFGAILATLKRMFSMMDELISVHFGDAVENIGTVEAAIELINEKDVPNIYNDYTGFSKLIFKNVSFTYPNQTKHALNNLSFEINRGEKIALVGINGSGKSTLSKLILGLYKPDEGVVMIEKNRMFDSGEDRRTVIFQEYARYKMSVEDNVRISDFDKAESPQVKIDLFAKDIKVSLQTILGKEFGNEDLSGGQWQSLAIARGFYRDANLIILDEPTASIDPIKEDQYYMLFKEELKDKTAILVTHHLASVKIADRIILLKDGEIQENGSFDTLMDLKGEFYKIFSAQADAFKNS